MAMSVWVSSARRKWQPPFVVPSSSQNSPSSPYEEVTGVRNSVNLTLSLPKSAGRSDRSCAVSSLLHEELVSSLPLPQRDFYNLPVFRTATHSPRGLPQQWATS